MPPEELPSGFFAESNFFSTVAVGMKQDIQNPTYLDVNTLVNVTNGRELVADILAVNNSIYNILSTPIGSRIFQPRYGSSIMNLIHEPMDDLTAYRIWNELIDAIERWEPRIKLLPGQTKVQMRDQNDTGFNVLITYEILLSKLLAQINFTVSA